MPYTPNTYDLYNVEVTLRERTEEVKSNPHAFDLDGVCMICGYDGAEDHYLRKIGAWTPPTPQCRR
jgi:hypothetical protein